MTPRMSLRAAAREIYGELAEKDDGSASAPAAQPYTAPAAVGPDLMAQVRALYEDSAVPVREIAARAGVTERTLYRYVERQNWRRRYTCIARDQAVAAANRGRGWRVGEGFAPAKGAGGRFVRREHAGKPFAKGPHALDPAARAEAEAECAAAARHAQEAQRQAEDERRFRNCAVAMKLALRIFRDIEAVAARRGERAPTPLEAKFDRVQYALANKAVAQWEALIPQNPTSRRE